MGSKENITWTERFFAGSKKTEKSFLPTRPSLPGLLQGLILMLNNTCLPLNVAKSDGNCTHWSKAGKDTQFSSRASYWRKLRKQEEETTKTEGPSITSWHLPAWLQGQLGGHILAPEAERSPGAQ